MRKKRRKEVENSRLGVGLGLSTFVYTLISIAVPLLSAFFAQVLENGSFLYTLDWLVEHPYVYLANAIVLCACMYLFVSITGNLFFGLSAFTFAVFIISYISYFKTRFLGEPLLPWDFGALRELTNVMPRITDSKNSFFIFICVIFCIGIAAMYKVIRIQKPSLINRICILITSLLILFSACFYSIQPFNAILGVSGVDMDSSEANHRYQVNGIFLSFFMSFQDMFGDIPSSYSKDRIVRMEDQILQLGTNKYNTEEPENYPDIIYVLNESFWDPTALTGYVLSADPLTTFHKLDKMGYVKSIVTPQLGWKSCNFEFELLTGLSTYFIPNGNVPYLNGIDNVLPSLPAYLKTKGYKTVFICGDSKQMWNRETVEKQYMSFDECIFKEDFITELGKECLVGSSASYNDYVSDEAITSKIISLYENTEEPLYIFAVTSENAAPYTMDKYPKTVSEDDNQIEIVYNNDIETDETTGFRVKGIIYEQRKKEFEVYMRGLKRADIQLKTLTEYFEKADNKVNLIFSGNHIPVFDGFYGLFSEGNIVESAFSFRWTAEEKLNMHSVPVVYWCNKKIVEEIPETPGTTAAPEGEEVREPETTEVPDLAEYMCDGDKVSGWLVPSVILEWCDIPMNDWFRQVWRKGEIMPVLINGVVIDESGILYDSVPDTVMLTYDAYWNMNYDIMNGYRYSMKYLFNKKIKENTAIGG